MKPNKRVTISETADASLRSLGATEEEASNIQAKYRDASYLVNTINEAQFSGIPPRAIVSVLIIVNPKEAKFLLPKNSFWLKIKYILENHPGLSADNMVFLACSSINIKEFITMIETYGVERVISFLDMEKIFS